MNIRHKILLLATMPLIVSVSAIAFLVSYQAKALSEDVIILYKENMLAAKKLELLNYLSLAQTSIAHIYKNASSTDEIAQGKVKQILHALTYGEDGYFFVYDYAGVNLVHPKLPDMVGHDWWDLKDRAGDFVIRNLIQQAKNGGGYHQYLWEKPSTGETVDKISYAIGLKKWGWMLGTGLYIDDVVKQAAYIGEEISQRIRQTSYIILGIAFGSLVIVFVTGVAINLHEMRMADVKQKELTQRIIKTQEEERGRVARELHDGISQILVSVRYHLEAALKKGMQGAETAITDSIRTSTDGLNMAIKEVRRISRDLRPSMLDDLGLSPALNGLADEFSARTGMRVEIKTIKFKDLLPKDAKTALFRVVQEALMNVERHSGADHIVVNLSAPAGAVTLTISDNGKGFDATSTEAGRVGLGLRNMRERLEHYNGTLRVTSSAKGTTIKAQLPKELLRSKRGEETEGE